MDFKITIVGAGVVGLAIASKFSNRYSKIVVLEKHKKFGQETSSRNSEVIHSGVYYPSTSLKSKLCIRGKELLYEYCKEHNINHNKCGKLIVATCSEEEKTLHAILEQSKKNGVIDSRIIGKDEIKTLEPNINAVAALQFPSTGIIDSYGLMKQFETESIINGVQFAYGNQVNGIRKIEGGYCIEVADEIAGSFEFTSEIVINASGLYAYEVSSMIGLKNQEYKIYYWKGVYFVVGNGKNKLIRSLIYPTPNENIIGLGVHATIDLNNRVKLGPNAIFLQDNKIDYSVDSTHKQSFFESAKKFLPFLEIDDLQPDQAGIRPKLQKPGDSFRDFIINNETDKGYPNFINLLGIESPGLTSCLAIAEYVDDLMLNDI